MSKIRTIIKDIDQQLRGRIAEGRTPGTIKLQLKPGACITANSCFFSAGDNSRNAFFAGWGWGGAWLARKTDINDVF